MAKIGSVKEAFDLMPSKFNASAAKGVDAVFQFNLTGDGGGNYNLVVKDGTLEVNEGTHGSPSITITMTANDYVSMANGELNPTSAFMSGKLKFSGSMGLAMQMQSLFPMG